MSWIVEVTVLTVKNDVWFTGLYFPLQPWISVTKESTWH